MLNSTKQKGLCNLSEDSEQVVDADEEVFILYTELQGQDYQSLSSSGTFFRGLGHVDSHQDILVVKFSLTNPAAASSASDTSSESFARSTSPRRARKKRETRAPDEIEFEIQIAQDKTSLRSRKGDTGSVVWRASVDFAFTILRNAHFPLSGHISLLNLPQLKNAHVLELGFSGTGILGVALSPFVRHYTCTDIHDLIPLLHKNLVLNFAKWPQESNVSLRTLDWIKLQKTTASDRHRLFKFDPVDLLLIVDCIYHPSLVAPLLETINHMAVPDVTTVLVVVELRAEDVIREFLSCWLSFPGWEIWGIGKGKEAIMKKPYAIWVGMKHNPVNND